jgi:hypothetical protein
LKGEAVVNPEDVNEGTLAGKVNKVPINTEPHY